MARRERGAWLLCCLLLSGPALATDAATRLEEARYALLQGQLEQSMAIWTELAGEGNADAQYLLALQLVKGHDSESHSRAVGWLRAAARQGHPRAQFSLAQAYERGDGVAQDLPAAIGWYRKAAAGEHRQAQRRLAQLAEADASPHDPVELFRAVRRGDAGRVEQLLASGQDANPLDVRGRTPLMYAAELGHAECVRRLLQHGASAAGRDAQGDTPLLLAVRAGQAESAAALLDGDAPVDLADRHGNSALLVAARRDDTRLLALLLQHGADPNLTNKAARSALGIALDAGYKRSASLLRRAGAQRAAAERDNGEPALRIAAATRGAEAEQWPPLVVAAWRGQDDLLRDLLAAGADVDGVDQDGHTALMRAAHQRHASSLTILLEHGAGLEWRDAVGRTALLHAAAQGHLQVVGRLLTRGADPMVRDHAGGDALSLAIAGGHESVALRLLASAPGLARQTAGLIERAVAADMPALTTALLDAGSPSSGELSDALGKAVSHGKADLAGLLLQAGAGADKVWHGRSLLETAVARDEPKLVAVLLAANADPMRWQDAPPLALAAGRGNAEIVRRLLEGGAEVNGRDRLLYTPLMRAAASGHLAVAELLLEHGAETAMRNRDGDNAASLAERAGFPEMQQRLSQTRGGLLGWLQ